MAKSLGKKTIAIIYLFIYSLVFFRTPVISKISQLPPPIKAPKPTNSYIAVLFKC